MAQRNKHPVLKMPLDLNSPVDAEVFKIFEEFRSGVEAKNFICSAILYYSRSPLVLSANALSESLNKINLDDRFDQVMAGLMDIKNKINSGFVVSDVIQPCNDAVDVVNTSVVGGSVLSNLKQKFKV